MRELFEQGREGKIGVTAGCLAALLRGDESVDADAGALALADGIHELRQVRRILEAFAKALSR